MTFVIQAPYPNMRTTLVLPSPREGNTESLRASVQTIRAMDGTVYTYVKPKRGRRKFQWDFVTSKDKGVESIEFIKKYAGSVVKTVDHLGQVRVGWVTINPIETIGNGRASSWGERQEAVSFSIEFEERV